MRQELGRGNLEKTSSKTVSREGYVYVCSKCNEVNKLRSKLQEKPRVSTIFLVKKMTTTTQARRIRLIKE